MHMQKSLVKAVPHALAYARDFLLATEPILSTIYESCLVF